MDPDALRHGVVKELVKLVTNAHRSNNAYTEELRRSLQLSPLVARADDSTHEGNGGEAAASSTSDRATDARALLWHHVALRMTPSVQQIVEFAKRLPGFLTLPLDDQLILIKHGFFEVWLTRATRLATPECVVFEDGTFITQPQFDIVYDVAFSRGLMGYVRTMLSLSASDEEMAVFTGSLLLCPHRAGLSDAGRINALNRALGDALQQAVAGSGVADAAGRLAAFNAACADMRALGLRHHVLMGYCREHWPRLMLPALFAEVFDIPKREEKKAADADQLPGVNMAEQDGAGRSHPGLDDLYHALAQYLEAEARTEARRMLMAQGQLGLEVPLANLKIENTAATLEPKGGERVRDEQAEAAGSRALAEAAGSRALARAAAARYLRRALLRRPATRLVRSTSDPDRRRRPTG